MVRKDKVRKNLSQRYDEGRLARRTIDTTKRLTGGVMFKCNHIVLDEDILKYRESKEKEKVDQKEGIIVKAIEEYKSRKLAYDNVMNGNVTKQRYKAEHYKAIIHFKKKKADKAVPQLISQLKQRYRDIKDRTIFTLQEFLTDRGLDKDDDSKEIIQRLLSPTRDLEEELEHEVGETEQV